MATILGEYGNHSGVWVVSTVRGHSTEIRKLWRKLDGADAIQQDRIMWRLREIGAAKREV